MKKNSLKTAVLMTIMALPLALYLVGVKPLVTSDGDAKLNYIESSEDVDSDEKLNDSRMNLGIAAKLGAIETTDEFVSTEEVIIIDIAGEIVTPGVYALKEGSRIIDAIDIAGGLTENADVKYINRAEIIFDGSKIYIPSKEESAQGGGTTYAATGRTTVTGGANQLININTAESEELQRIPGVGPSTAEKIIAYRTTYGKFKTIEDMINISGIGNKTLEKMKGYITVR